MIADDKLIRQDKGDDVFNASDSDTLVQSTSQGSPAARTSVDSAPAIENEVAERKTVKLRALSQLLFCFNSFKLPVSVGSIN